jgi:hypothetical protein
VEEKIVNLVSKLQNVLFHIFPKIMESLEDKWRRFNIMDGEEHLVDGSSFTTYAFLKHYGINFHTDLDDDDVCFIIWLEDGISSNLG